MTKHDPRYRTAMLLKPGEPRASSRRSCRFQLAIRTQAEVARLMGITAARVQQIERLAMSKLRSALNSYSLEDLP